MPVELRTYSDYGEYLGSDREVDTITRYPDLLLELRAASDHYMETISDAGRYWAHCEFTQQHLQKTNEEIKAIFNKATKRRLDSESKSPE